MRRTSVFAWLRMVRVVQKVEHATNEHLRAWDLNPAQFDVLAHIGAAEGMVQQELADSLLVTKGNVCQLLNRMEGCGWIMRCQDGRANRLYLTPAGRRLYDEVVPAHEAHLMELFATLSPEEQAQLLRLLRALDHSLH